jgi:serine/threonine protein kinase
MNGSASRLSKAMRSIEPRAGDRIEKYELLFPMAQGGMGSVWAAKLHGSHGFAKVVAIKMVLPELVGDARIRAMFLEEARLASAIVHRNVAQVVDFLEHRDGLYLVMEWVDGSSLVSLSDQLAERGARVPIGVALRILSDVCAGLHAAHELRDERDEPCGLVHRDVCPHNVLVAREGSAKLTDFGVAKTRLCAASDTTLGELRGRVAFMSPEQARSDAIDRRADIWSVGASLLHLLSRQGPFGPCETHLTLRRLLANTRPLPPPPDTHPAVARVLAGCLAQRPEDRFPTAQHLGWAIEEAIEDLGLAATPRDVADFLAEKTDIGRAKVLKSGCCAVPRNVSFETETHSRTRIRRKRKTPATGRAPARPSRAGFALFSALVFALACIGARFASDSGSAPPVTVAAKGVSHPQKVEIVPHDRIAPGSLVGEEASARDLDRGRRRDHLVPRPAARGPREL